MKQGALSGRPSVAAGDVSTLTAELQQNNAGKFGAPGEFGSYVTPYFSPSGVRAVNLPSFDLA